MKKILFALAIMPLLIVACSNDDNPSNSDFDHNIELLYGQWRATSVVVGGVTIDLTTPKNELMVTPTYLTFKNDGSLLGEGLFGEGSGKYTAKDKTIATSIGSNKVNFEMTSLSQSTAKIKVNAKALGLPKITGEAESVVIELKKDYNAKIDFDHNIEMLYGEWHATTLVMEGKENIDLTHIAVKQSYVTYEKKGVYSTKGFLGEGKGRFTTEDKTIYTLIGGEKSFEYEMTSLDATTAKIKLNPQFVDFGFLVDKDVKMATVVFTKQKK